MSMSLAVAVYGFRFVPQRIVEPAGISYEFNVIKDKLALGLSTLPVLQIQISSDLDQSLDLNESLVDGLADWLDKEDNKYHKYMSKLDPNESKEQDHYRVLGLSSLRFNATAGQIKTAYRQKVLRYHPDKGKSSVTGKRKEELFACIQKAYEQLGDSIEKRRAYDSVDPKFDDSIPDKGEVNKTNFFNLLTPVYARNARFSINQPVPLLGDVNSTREHVEHFYEFWYDLKSWREFSYLDSEDKTKGEDRYERREIEKINKVEREKHRKKEIKRISSLIDMTYENDPRVVAFKEQDRLHKIQMKQKKKNEKQKLEIEKQVQVAVEEKVKEADRQAQIEEDKKASQAKQKKRKVLSGQRRKLRDLAHTAGYWSEEESKKHDVMIEIERICMNAAFEEMSSLCEKLAEIKLFEEAMQQLKDCVIEDDKDAVTELPPKENKTANGNGVVQLSSKWSTDELQLLVKAANIYPPGCSDRWRNVAEYVSNHAAIIGGNPRTEKEVIKQVKALSLVDANSANASQIKEHTLVIKENGKLINESVPTINHEEAALIDEWSVEQQKDLETALKKFKPNDPDRWDKISEAVSGKSKKECIKRYKKLVELVRKNQSKNQK